MSDHPNPELESRVGSTVGERYRLVRLVGAGGMGAVYEAINTWTERRVAIKLLTAHAAPNSEMVNRFMREARVATRIAHENVVDVLDMGRDATGVLYIVQEFLDGMDLRHLLDERKKLARREAIEIAAPIMAGLVAAHRLGVVHRDLKPENIFLARLPQGGVRPKLIDFGVAKIAEAQHLEGNLTRTGSMMGTPYYMAPEQARGEKHVDARVDVWAMGVVLYEMLAGRCPFEADNYNALLVQIIGAPIPPLRGFAPEVPASVAAVIHRALERDRDHRFDGIASFLSALLESAGAADLAHDAWAPHPDVLAVMPTELRISDTPPRYTPARPSDRPARLSSHSTMTAVAREIGLGPRRWGAWQGWLAAAAVVVACVAGLGSVRWASRQGGSRLESTTPVMVMTPTTRLSPHTAVTAAATYHVHVTARPAAATLVMDDEGHGARAIERVFPLNGTRHRLRVNAPGYQSTAVEFVDAAPAEMITLSPIAPRPSAPRHAARATATASAPRVADPPPSSREIAQPTVASAPRSEASPPVLAPQPVADRRTSNRTQMVNGAPVLED